MKVFYFIKKVVGKSIVLAVWSVSSVFATLFNLFTAIYRILSVPIAILGLFFAGSEIYSGALSMPTGVGYMSVFLGLLIVRQLLPAISYKLAYFNESMKNYVFAPIFVAPPVHFTL